MSGFIRGFLTIFATMLVAQQLPAAQSCYRVNSDYNFSALSIRDGMQIAEQMGVGTLRALKIFKSIDMTLDQIRTNPQAAFEVCISENILKPEELRKLAERNYIIPIDPNDKKPVELAGQRIQSAVSATTEPKIERYNVEISPENSSMALITSADLVETGLENGLHGIERALVGGLSELSRGNKTNAAIQVLSGGAQTAVGAVQVGLGVCDFLFKHLQKSKR